MSEFDVEQLKEKRLEELKQQIAAQQAAQQEQLQAEIQLNALLRNILSPEAKQRLSNISLVNKELYLQVSQVLLYLAKAGQLQGRISDEQLKSLLEKIKGKKREIQIKRL